MATKIWDCAIVGGGPAGLTAAVYLARFHLSVIVIDSGKSRAGIIPLTRNHAGFPDGISGPVLLARMRRHAVKSGAKLVDGRVEVLKRTGEGFSALVDGETQLARAVLIATGVVNRRPPMMDEEMHDRAVADGRLRYCPICDGYEVTDLRVAVLGTGARGCKEAIFLRSYTDDVTLFAPDRHDLSAEQEAQLSEAGIVIAGPCRTITLAEGKIVVGLDEGAQSFDSLYPALGSDIRSELAGQLGADRTDDGCLRVDAHQRTNVPGLYAAGDVVKGLDQISHAMGEGGVAATTIRNDLAKQTPLRR
ncbi:MAG: NAD(P)/FAD-dependent oxidoreductase [Novosphingobium sp.]|nr:NAD(P)/FAD-dependent oxidoreductase [Novosphingobium sp.]